MKIDILSEPPADIFKDQGKYKNLFILFLGVASIGVLLGVYAVLSDTKHYDILEKAAMICFVGSAIPLFYVGEKLQAYKKLTPPQQKELSELSEKYFEIQGYCYLVARLNRRIIFAEFEACQNWAEERDRQAEQDKKY